MTTSRVELDYEAEQNLKIGGDVEKAKAIALILIARALSDIAAALEDR